MGTKIRDLLEEIQHKELVLPEFQREFTWNRTQVRRLFESLRRGYPTGSLLIWVTENPPKIKNDAYDLDKVRRVKVLLDGQQRLTSLYLHINGAVPPYYTMDEIGESFFELYFNLLEGEFRYYRKLEMEGDPLWRKVSALYASRPSVFDLVEQVESDEGLPKEELYGQIEENITALEEIRDREYPVQKVPSDAHIREAIKVFDLINSQGTPLSQADIALAYMTAEWPDIRRKFKEKVQALAGENFEFDLTFMTRCLVGIVSGVGELERFGGANENELKEGWKKLDASLDYLISFLKNKAHIVGTGDLNTPNVLVPLVVFLAHCSWFSRPEEDLFLYWVYAALFQRRYSGSTETYLDQDIRTLLDEPIPDTLIANLKEDEGEPEVTPGNLDMRGVGHPLYNMMSVVIRARGAVDWSNGLPLSKNVGKKFNIERHHIFPKSVLSKAGWDTSKSQYDKKRVHEIANRIPLTQDGNLEIFDQPPSEYLATVEKRHPGILEKSLVPSNPELWKVENYELFLQKRRELIAAGINEFMNALREERTAHKMDPREALGAPESEVLEKKSGLTGSDGAYHLEMAVLKSIAGMLNRSGGQLLIGVDDSGNAHGLERDYQALGKKGRDAFVNHIMNIVESKVGARALPLVQPEFFDVDGEDVCVVSLDSSPRPVYLKDGNEKKFYVRFGNSTRPLNVEEASEYISEHFD